MTSLVNSKNVALVTGSGKRRVGWHVAEALAARGYALAVHYRSSAVDAAETVDAFRARGVEAFPLQADLTDEQSVRSMIEAVLARFGRLDVLVNCILPGPVMLPPDLPPAERKQAIDATLVKREGRPEHIAQAVLFFVDNDFVTGTCLPVDGGRTIFAPDSL